MSISLTRCRSMSLGTGLLHRGELEEPAVTHRSAMSPRMRPTSRRTISLMRSICSGVIDRIAAIYAA